MLNDATARQIDTDLGRLARVDHRTREKTLRLIAFAADNGSQMGVVRDDEVTPLCSVEDFYADVAGHLAAARSASGSEVALAACALVPFVPTAARVLCVGLNYKSHAAESSMELPSAPNIFARWASTLCVDGDEIPLPPAEPRLDWEGELGVIVGSTISAASIEESPKAILGFTCFNDVSTRGFQMAVSQWALGKNGDRSGPIGPVLVTADEIPDPYNLHIETRVNNVVMQSGTTADMIFRIDQVLSYASGAMTLRPGDVIATGTPEGVGFTREPPVFLASGDVVEIEIGSIGVLRNVIA